MANKNINKKRLSKGQRTYARRLKQASRKEFILATPKK